MESRVRRKIRAALAEYGMHAEEIIYESIGQMVEMQGREGGWTIWVKDYGVVTGYRWQDVIEAIRDLAPAWLDGSAMG